MTEPQNHFPPPGHDAGPPRVEAWQLEEMTGGPDGETPWWEEQEAPAPRESLGRRSSRAVGRVLGLLFRTVAVVSAAVLIAAGAMYLHGDLSPSGLLGRFLPGPAGQPLPKAGAAQGSAQPPAAPGAGAADGAAPAPRAVTDHPPGGLEENASPLGSPAPLARTSPSYAFLHKGDDGKPYTYDPCRPIHYVTRAANSPADGPALIREAIAAVSRATGLVFIDDGATSEAPAAEHKSYQPERYGNRWAPVLIAWETTAEEPRFTNKAVGTNVMGLGGSEAVSIGNSGFTYVSGQLELNGPAMQAMIGREGPAQARGVIEHELGHVVGLDHVQDPSQLMNPTDSIGVTTYQAGDLTGLAALGQGACRPEI